MQMSPTSPERCGHSCQPATGRRRTSCMRCRVRRCGGPAPLSRPQHVYSWFRLRQYGIYMPGCGRMFRPSILGESPWDADLRQLMDWTCLKLDSQVHAWSTLRLSCRRVPHPRGQIRARRDRESGALATGKGTERFAYVSRGAEESARTTPMRGAIIRRVAPGTSTRSCASTASSPTGGSWSTSGPCGTATTGVARGRAPLCDPTLTDGT
jgi:hypothetical protein